MMMGMTIMQMGDNGIGDIACWTFAQNPESGDAILDENVFDSIG